MKDVWCGLRQGALMLAAMFAMGFILAFIIMICWNYVIVSTFGLPELDYWKAYAIHILAMLLIKPSMAPIHHSHNGGAVR